MSALQSPLWDPSARTCFSDAAAPLKSFSLECTQWPEPSPTPRVRCQIWLRVEFSRLPREKVLGQQGKLREVETATA